MSDRTRAHHDSELGEMRYCRDCDALFHSKDGHTCMRRGNHSKRDAAPVWAVRLLLLFILAGLLWSTWALLFA